jgi:hypothetical protein
MRLLTELVAIAALWMIWGWRVGLTAGLVLLVVGELLADRRRRSTPRADEIPTLQEPAEAPQRRER